MQTLRHSEESHRQSRSLRVIPNSDVTSRTKNMTNAGISAAAGLVPGALPGQQRVSNAVERESGLSRSRANC